MRFLLAHDFKHDLSSNDFHCLYVLITTLHHFKSYSIIQEISSFSLFSSSSNLAIYFSI